jgi:hypothetical protein
MTPPLHPAAFAALLRRITRPGRYCPRVANRQLLVNFKSALN